MISAEAILQKAARWADYLFIAKAARSQSTTSVKRHEIPMYRHIELFIYIFATYWFGQPSRAIIYAATRAISPLML